jgi:hypothetical protein
MEATWILFVGIGLGSLAAQSHVTIKLNNAAKTPHRTVSMAEAAGSSPFERAGILINGSSAFRAARIRGDPFCKESSDAVLRYCGGPFPELRKTTWVRCHPTYFRRGLSLALKWIPNGHIPNRSR